MDGIEKLKVLADLLKVVQEGYVKPDQNRQSANTTGIIRDAKDAKQLYFKLLEQIEKELEKF